MENTIDLGSFKDLDKLTDGYRYLGEEESREFVRKYKSYGTANIVIVTICLDILWFIFLGLFTIFTAVKIKDEVKGFTFLAVMCILLIGLWIATPVFFKWIFRRRLLRMTRVKTVIMLDWFTLIPNSGNGLVYIERMGVEYIEGNLPVFMFEHKDMKNAEPGCILYIYTDNDGKQHFAGTK